MKKTAYCININIQNLDAVKQMIGTNISDFGKVEIVKDSHEIYVCLSYIKTIKNVQNALRYLRSNNIFLNCAAFISIDNTVHEVILTI